MNCKEIQKILSDYLDRAVSESQNEEIALHLESCKTCQSEFEQLQKTISMVRDLPSVSAPAGLVGSVMEKIQEKQAIRGKLRFWLAGIACAEIVAFVLIYKLHSPVKIVFEPQKPDIEMQQKIVEKSLPQTKENRETIVERKQEKVVYVLKRDAEKQEKPEILIQIDARQQKTLAFARGEKVYKEKSVITPSEDIFLQRGKPGDLQDRVMEGTEKQLPAASSQIPERPDELDLKTEIYQWITGAGGKILSEQQTSETEISSLIIANIPGSVYKDFLENLNRKFNVANYNSIKAIVPSEDFVTIKLQIFK
ncbi:MAG: anti-sigma factor [Candidatus Omnitrophica bacterium]|nr:anti-sigma factor [Candidatus Omnitrophota bacterium]